MPPYFFLTIYKNTTGYEKLVLKTIKLLSKKNKVIGYEKLVLETIKLLSKKNKATVNK